MTRQVGRPNEPGGQAADAAAHSGDAGGGNGGAAVVVRAPRRRRRLGWLGAGVVLVAIAAGVAWVAGTRVRSPEQAAADAAAPARTMVTVPVERRVLESTVVTRGDVAPEVAVAVNGPTPEAAGDAVVTGLFVQVGDEVNAGVPVVEVSGRPVFVMTGERPVYRTLGPQLVGADVRQLQAGLVAGGCDAGDSGIFDEATKLCVDAMYDTAGYAVVRASTSEEADLAAGREAVADAGDALADAEAELANAEAGPTELELLDAGQAVESAQSGLDSATAGADSAGREATAAVNEALRGLNGQLVAANPDADDDTGGADGAEGSGDATAAGGGGVAGRAAAADTLRQAVDGVTTAQVTSGVEVDAAQAALTRADAELAALEAAPDLADQQRAVDQASLGLERAQAALETLQAASGPTVPLGELVFVASLPARVDSLTAAVGAPVGNSSAAAAGPEEPGSGTGSDGGLMVLSSAGLVVNVELPAGDAALVSTGSKAEVLEESSGVVVDGTVARVGGSLVTSQDGGLVSMVTLTGVETLPADWSGRNVRVTFTAASTGDAVLVVPVIAVSSGADGHERVAIVADDGVVRQVPVRTGLEADGFIEVAPLTQDELDEGDKVVTDQ